MPNRAWLILGLVIVGAIAADAALNDGRALIFLGNRFLQFLWWLAFWR